MQQSSASNAHLAAILANAPSSSLVTKEILFRKVSYTCIPFRIKYLKGFHPIQIAIETTLATLLLVCLGVEIWIFES